MTKDEYYIEHEVTLRVHEALFNHMDYKFTSIERRIDKMDSKFNLAVGLLGSGVVIPLIMRYFGI